VKEVQKPSTNETELNITLVISIKRIWQQMLLAWLN